MLSEDGIVGLVADDLRPLDVGALKPALNNHLIVDERGLAQLESYFSRVKEAGYDIETNVVPSFYNSTRDLTGLTFGLLTVTSRVQTTFKRRSAYWLCECSCGTTTRARGSHLVTGGIRSCGCLRRIKVGTHNMSNSREYTSWHAMKSRCSGSNSSNYEYYAGRGITVCDRWLKSFENFLADMGPRPPGTTLERKENNGNYEPDNCKWANPTQQSRNRRSSVITKDIITTCLVEILGGSTIIVAARKRSISEATLRHALKAPSWSDVVNEVMSTEESLTS